MAVLKQFMVSCFNETTGAVVYQNQFIKAQDSVRARKMADEAQDKPLSDLPTGTSVRYVISPVEGDGL